MCGIGDIGDVIIMWARIHTIQSNERGDEMCVFMLGRVFGNVVERGEGE